MRKTTNAKATCAVRAAPNLTAEVFRPGNCKQNVTKALALVEPSTIAVIGMYIPESKNAIGFLQLVHIYGGLY